LPLAQEKHETASSSRIILHPYRSAVSLDNGPADRQSKPDSLACQLFPLFDLVEFLKDFFLIPIRNSRP
jgi:hypothetical protein